MAQEVCIANATYSDVPAISVPDSSNVFHSFYDISDTTLTAAGAVAGTYFYTALGVKTAGSLADGNSIGYGLSDRTLAMVGVGQAGYAVI